MCVCVGGGGLFPFGLGSDQLRLYVEGVHFPFC